MAAFDNLQAELDKMQRTSVNNTTSSVGGSQNTPMKLLVSNNSGNFMQGTSLLANPQHSQLLQFSSVGGQITQTVGKRHSSNQSGPMTKVIIRNTSTGQQQIVPISGNQSLVSNTIMVSSPTKTITLSGGTLGSPQKILTTPATPTKQIVPLGKLPITPLKTPPKITMIPVSIGKSPRQGSGQMVTMLGTKSSFAGGALTTTATSKPTTITMSPSKVIIKGQPVTMQPGMQQMMNTNVGGANSLVAPRPSGPASTSLQPLSVSGSKFQYVRLVTAPVSQQSSAVGKPTQMQPVNARSIMPSHIPAGNMKIAMQPLQQVQQPKSGNFVSQRLILPATTQIPIQPSRPQTTLAQIRPITGSTHISQIGGTTSINLQNLQGVQGFTLVPANQLSNQLQYVTQVQSQPPAPTVKQENYVQIASSGPPPTSTKNNFNGSTSASSDNTGQRPRKPCNCTKSQCLKLYCDCFANGEFCSNCNCNNCANNLDHEDERSRAIKSCLERNPLAFHPKIGGYKTGKGRGEGDRRHNKGCNCKRSGCLKNYCECYEAKIMCSNLCKCVGCKNFEESPDRKTLMHLADAAEVRVQQQTAAKSKLSSQIADLPPRPAAPAAGERLPFTFVTGDVAEATCACLVAQAEEAERTRQIEMVTERMILEEFGRCLMQVIESANRTKAYSPVP